MNSHLEKLVLWTKKKYYLSKYPTSLPASIEWLVGTEIKYGGYITNIPAVKISPKDPRSKKQVQADLMAGGDRMLHHGYANNYSEYLAPFLKNAKKATLLEIGILKGTGLAIWCDLLPSGRIIGLDIDLGHINNNMENLNGLGAFKKNKPELYEFDQFSDNAEYLGTILKNDKVDICIDDGFHSDESILLTMKSVLPHLKDNFLYFIEDNKYVHQQIRAAYPNLQVENSGRLTVVSGQKT